MANVSTFLLPGLHTLHTLGSTGQRSIPRSQRAVFLDLFVLQNHKDRLVKERAVLRARRKQIDQRLKNTNKQMKRFLRLAGCGDKILMKDSNSAFSEKQHKKSTVLEY